MDEKALSVNEDLVRERKRCTFDVKELIHLIDGGEELTRERKKLGLRKNLYLIQLNDCHLVIAIGTNILACLSKHGNGRDYATNSKTHPAIDRASEDTVFSVPELRDEVPEAHLSHKEKYERAVQKSTILFELLQDSLHAHAALESFSPSNLFRSISGVLNDVSPFWVHIGMFVPALLGHGSPEQQMEWLPKALSIQFVGTYAQTELGHGTFVRGLETTATYDPETEEFVLNTPTLTAYKWWPGGLGNTANHCVVIAQLYTNGKCYGVHPFLVQLRDTETHMPRPGIKIGEIGPKLGYNTGDNGFLAFDNLRIPRENMMMRNSKVLKDGTYVKSKNDKSTYGTMVFVRVTVVTDSAFELSRAVTIAIRYSAVRRQSQIKPGQPEAQILDYVTQQHKLFVPLVTSHAFRVVGMWLWNTYMNVIRDLNKGNLDQLPELHALACCLKAVCSADGATCVEQCRLSCGGHGYMQSSNLPTIYGITTAAVTYEGEYTVMLLQTARFLVKAWKHALEGRAMTPTVAYLVDFYKNHIPKWENTPQGIIKGFQAVAAGKTKAAYDAIQKQIKAGHDFNDSWNLASVQLINASKAHCRSVLCEVYWNETQRMAASVSPTLAAVLRQMAELYMTYWVLQKSGDFLIYSTTLKTDVTKMQERYEQLLGYIRPNAVGIVDGFDIRDEILNSTLGAYDGRVYERLIEEAMKSPLNAEPVNQSFHKHLKPFMIKSRL